MIDSPGQVAYHALPVGISILVAFLSTDWVQSGMENDIMFLEGVSLNKWPCKTDTWNELTFITYNFMNGLYKRVTDINYKYFFI